MNDVLIFAGTSEGRKLAEYLNFKNINIHVCVATEYGSSILPNNNNVLVSSKRLDLDEMKTLMLSLTKPLVIDATHPYAEIVSKNIKKACGDLNTKHIRLLRDSQEAKDTNCIYFDSLDHIIEYLKTHKGNVLATTGSKELKKYTAIKDYKKRVFARILSTKESIDECIKIGFEGSNLICMQGPFSEDINYAMLKQLECKYLVTKESGMAGGFIEKINAAKRADASVLIVGRPVDEEGIDFESCIKLLNQTLNIPQDKKIVLAGIGMGSLENMTLESIKAFEEADVIIGAKRILEAVSEFNKPNFVSYKDWEIKKFIQENDEYINFVVAFSGDVGFCSGAKKTYNALKEFNPKVLPGITTVSYLSSKVGISWEDTCLLSQHGKDENILNMIAKKGKVFALMGGENSVQKLCQQMIDANMKDLTITVGEKLSYEDEKITVGPPLEIVKNNYDTLCAVLIQNPLPNYGFATHGIRDEEFIRDKAPMTKEEIRCISLSKLMLKSDSIVYDIGAGTGSVAVEIALRAFEGKVYAIEKNPSSVELIETNKKKFGTYNLETICALAPEGLENLPMPSHAFIGGSSGNMMKILQKLIDINPKIRIVINVLTLETLSEITVALKQLNITNANIINVSVSKAKKLGKYNMMESINPVYIISFTGNV